MNNINYDKYKKINDRINTIKSITNIKQIINETKLEKYLFKPITSFLYGNFIEIKFKDNNDLFYFFKKDIISSETLLKLFHNSEQTGKNVYKLDIEYNKLYFKLIVKYLIYNDNKDNIGAMVYNNNSLLYLKDSDDYNNNLIFQLNYFELTEFQRYIDYFKIKVLEFKVGAILDIINICMKSTIKGHKNKPLKKFI